MVTRVLHLTGSSVDDFHADLSHLYARDCLAATAAPDLEHVVADVRPDGAWAFPADLSTDALVAARPVSVAEAVAQIAALDVDVALPQLFDRPGMTTHRALLDLLRVPYVGSTPTTMALAADKPRARAVVAAAGVPVPAGEVVSRGGEPSLDPPVVVKPAASDNSVGVRLVRDRVSLDVALVAAWDHGEDALVEYVAAGREVRCGTLAFDGEVVPLPLEEYPVDEDAAPVRTAADKLARDDDGQLRLVAKGADRAWIVADHDPIVPAAQAVAVAAHRALGCRHYGLFDLRVDDEGRPWFLEAGPYWSFARGSVLTAMAGAAGHDLPSVFRRALDAARGRDATEQRTMEEMSWS